MMNLLTLGGTNLKKKDWKIHNILYILTVLLIHDPHDIVASFIACTLCLFLLSRWTSPCPTLSLCYTIRQEWRQCFCSNFGPNRTDRTLTSCRIPQLVWATVEFNMTFGGMWRQKATRARTDKSAKWLSRHASFNRLLLQTPILNLTATHQVGAGLLTASLLHSAVTVGTVVLWCVDIHKHCLTKDCTGCWYWISTYCCTGGSLWVWHLSAEGQTSVNVVETFLFAVNLWLKNNLSQLFTFLQMLAIAVQVFLHLSVCLFIVYFSVFEFFCIFW